MYFYYCYKSVNYHYNETLNNYDERHNIIKKIFLPGKQITCFGKNNVTYGVNVTFLFMYQIQNIFH